MNCDSTQAKAVREYRTIYNLTKVADHIDFDFINDIMIKFKSNTNFEKP